MPAVLDLSQSEVIGDYVYLFGGIISAILIVLALIVVAFGFLNTAMVETQSAIQQQVQTLWMLKYIGYSIILLLIAVLVKLK